MNEEFPLPPAPMPAIVSNILFKTDRPLVDDDAAEQQEFLKQISPIPSAWTKPAEGAAAPRLKFIAEDDEEKAFRTPGLQELDKIFRGENVKQEPVKMTVASLPPCAVRQDPEEAPCRAGVRKVEAMFHPGVEALLAQPAPLEKREAVPASVRRSEDPAWNELLSKRAPKPEPRGLRYERVVENGQLISKGYDPETGELKSYLLVLSEDD